MVPASVDRPAYLLVFVLDGFFFDRLERPDAATRLRPLPPRSGVCGALDIENPIGTNVCSWTASFIFPCRFNPWKCTLLSLHLLLLACSSKGCREWNALPEWSHNEDCHTIRHLRSRFSLSVRTSSAPLIAEFASVPDPPVAVFVIIDTACAQWNE